MQCVIKLERVAKRGWWVYSRTYRVELHRRTGTWWAVGRARGLRAHYLDRLGPRASRDEMQLALDAWALRRGAREREEVRSGR